ncbi:hypothetical protein [Paractinoplanes globisporus]|uniref:Uncharacterized protein n=1 Tax=Paractinoplanes globisporus TaxID=113565 RepID=A0ABW6W8B2_9ACTN|nr:hypothetical protein [Actinoplanes globisporus]
MTPNHNHATLFVAPPATRGTEAAGRPRSTVDDGAEAMRRLRDPFAVRSLINPRRAGERTAE